MSGPGPWQLSSISFDKAPVPARDHPTTKAPPLADHDLEALTTLAKPAALSIYRYLTEHPSSYFGDIATATGVPTASVTRHLSELEASGLIEGDLPMSARRGRSVRYTALPDDLAALLRRVQDSLIGGSE